VYLCNNVSIFVKATLYFSLDEKKKKNPYPYFSLPETFKRNITPIKSNQYHHIYIEILFFEKLNPFFPFLILEKQQKFCK